MKCFFNMLATQMVDSGNCKEEDKETIAYGLLFATQSILTIFSAILVGIALNQLTECIVLLMSLSFLRVYSGGIHCKEFKNCYFLSVLVVWIILLCIQLLHEEIMTRFSIAVIIISSPVIWKHSPLETATKTLDQVEEKHFRKKAVYHLCLEIFIVIFFICINQLVLATVVSLAVFLCAMLLVAELVRRKFARGGSHSSEF